MPIDPKQYRPGFLKKAPERADALPPARSSCRMCPNRLKGWEKHYCSGECMQRAKLCGIYGNEGEALSDPGTPV